MRWGRFGRWATWKQSVNRDSAPTGIAAITLGALTLSAAGLVKVTGALSATLGALTLSSAGTVADAPASALNFRQVATNSGSTGAGTTLAVNKPTGVVDGDYMLLMCSSASIVTHTPPAGWDLVETVSETGTPNNKLSVYKRIASSEGSSYTFTVGTSFSTITLGIIAWYSSTGRTIALAGTATTNVTTVAGTSQVAAGMTTTVANATLHCFFTVSNSPSGTPHSGMDERWDTAGASAAYLMTENIAAAGATGTRTMTSGAGLTSAAITCAIAEVV